MAEHPVQSNYTTICRRCFLFAEGLTSNLHRRVLDRGQSGSRGFPLREPCLFSVKRTSKIEAPHGLGPTGLGHRAVAHPVHLHCRA